MSTPSDLFDVSTPVSRARLLASLKQHAPEFSPEEHELYDAFRDALVRIARGEDVADKVETYKAAFQHFLAVDDVTLPATPTMVMREPNTLHAVPAEAEPVESPVAEAVRAPEEQEAKEFTPTPIAPLRARISAVRRGPDVTVSPTPVAVPHDVGSNAEVVPNVRAPHVPEPIPEPTPVSEVVEESVPEAPTIVAPVTPDASPVPESREGLREEIEEINDALNGFAHGTAFKWLSDEKTGYRAYLNELLELRGLLSGPMAAAPDTEGLRARVKGLQVLADAVRKNVGIEVAPQPEPIFTEPAPETPQHNEEVVSTPPLSQSTQRVSISPGLAPLNIEPTRPQGDVVASAPEVVAQAAQTIPEEQAPQLVPDAPVETAVPEPLLKEGEPESALIDKVEAPDSPLLDPLHSRAIDAGLNELLTRWLGSTGFFGFGDSGVKHPDWLKMKDVQVDDALNGDGFVPEGLRQEIFENLGQNIRAWRDTFALQPLMGEQVEHYIRRVVEASLPKG